MPLASLRLPPILDSGSKHPRCFSASLRPLASWAVRRFSRSPRRFSPILGYQLSLIAISGILDAVGLLEAFAYLRW
jgi:hypothetical protein